MLFAVANIISRLYPAVACSVLFFCMSCCAQEVVTPLFPCTSKLESPYGVCVHFAHPENDYPTQRKQIALIKQLGIGNIRNDLWVPYNEKWRENALLPVIDSAVVRTSTSGLDFLGIVFGGWNKQRAWERKEHYFAFLDYLLYEYKNKIPYWEVVNEVNMTSREDKTTPDSTAAYYMYILPESYRRIKKANRNLLVTLSGLADINDDFLEAVCKLQAYRYFDVMNFHSYDLPEKIPVKFEKIRKAMDLYGWHKPVWITECGMPTHRDSVVKPWQMSNDERETEQARRLPRMYILSFAYGVDKVYTYKFRARETSPYYNEDHFGIVHADLAPKPAYYAYKTLTTMLPAGSSRPMLLRDGSVYFSSWKRKDGKQVYAVWCSKGGKTIQLESQGDYACYDIFGRAVHIDFKSFRVTPSMLYFVGGKKFELEYLK